MLPTPLTRQPRAAAHGAQAGTAGDDGFTLIELLVVILIIGILAAIAIPSFLNQRSKGQDACAKSMARAMRTAIETYQTDNNTYSGANVSALNAIESQITSNNCGGNGTLATGNSGAGPDCGGASAAIAASSGFCVASKSASGNWFAIDRTDSGTVSRICSVASAGNRGGCPGSGSANGTW